MNVSANRQTTQDENITKDMFALAYFMFIEEIPHTTNWRPLVSIASMVDRSSKLANFCKTAPANAHHLSTTSIADILHSFGKAHNELTLTELSDIGKFAVLADEGTDINGREMLSICVRYIKLGTIVERFL